jgi:FemAB-related protein (PEP-CTERM system-associated)
MIQAIEHLDPAVEREVSAFLLSMPEESGACGEHDPRWLHVLKDALGHHPMMLIARAGGESSPITGYLPLALVASRLFGRFLVSLPYLNRAGVVAKDAATASELIAKAVRLSDQYKAKYLELRHCQPIGAAALAGSRSDKFRMVLNLYENEEALMKAVGPKVRNLIRKGEKNNLSIRWGGREVLADFYEVFSVNMRDLGTPVYSRELFGRIVDQFKGEAELCVVDFEGKPVSGALLVHDDARKLTQVPSASALREFNHTSANMWMYFKLLMRSMERGSRRFDFGRSSEGSGTYKFKEQWGALPQPTVWQFHVPPKSTADIASMRPDNPKNQRRIAIWQKLPVWLTRVVGPRIVRGIP